jgi:P2 family phage contractile tail tube protein
MSNQIPERLINYRAYKDGSTIVGTVDVELPNLEAMTDTISGAGIAGEVDSPTLGHFGSLGTTINFRTISDQSFSLVRQMAHSLEFRGAQQINDVATGQLRSQSVRVAMRATPKNLSLGNLAVASATDTSNEFEVTYLRIDIDGVKQLELDKFGFVFEVGGEDLLAPVRRAMGM